MSKTILRVEGVDKRLDKQGKTYYISHLVLNDGLEGEGFGKDFKEGDTVKSFYDHQYDRVKIFKPKSR